MRLRWLMIAVVLCLLGRPQSASAQTRLEQIYNNMHPGPNFRFPDNPRTKQQGYWDQAFQNTKQGAIIAAGAGVGALATVPFWLPSVLLDESNLFFGKYPYAYPGGCQVRAADCKTEEKATDYWDNALITKGWALRASVDTGSNFDDLNRVGGQMFLDTNFYRFGVLANLNWYREHNPHGDSPTALMSDVNVTYRITQCEWLQMHVGAGMRAWNSLGDVSGGFNGLYRVELFPRKPVNLSSIIELGNLDQTFVMHFRTQIGYNFNHGELFLGYDLTRMAGVTLQGPLLGLRLWF